MNTKKRGKRARSLGLQDDPFADILKPPADETPDERARRLSAEQDAAKRSKDIDDALSAEKRELDRKNRMIKVLLLGQSESGKSTTLRNFQLTFAPAQFHTQRTAWRAVVQLNLIASVRIIIETLQSELADGQAIEAPMPLTSFNVTKGLGREREARAPSPGPGSPTGTRPLATFSRPKTPTRRQSTGPETFNASSGQRSAQAHPTLTTEHRKLIMRLGALLQVELQLARAINPDSPDCVFDDGDPQTVLASKPSRELVVRAGSAWMGSDGEADHAGDEPNPEAEGDAASVVSNASRIPTIGQPIFRDMVARMSGGRTRERARARERARQEEATAGPTAVLAACCEDIVALWGDPVVRDVLRRREVDIESYPGFFLDDAARIARADYDPTPDDILRARVQTLGVEEHYLRMEATTNGARKDWMIYDVGGHRSNRHKWIPYFENVDAIIFLAPLVFTQMLQEDPTVNRVEDSILIWKKICANPLLSGATLILFLNKMDIVSRMLENGVKLKDYVPSYGDQPNELGSVVKYFRSKFKTYMKTLSPMPRHSYCHETSVIDSSATSAILEAVRQGIILHNLAKAQML